MSDDDDRRFLCAHCDYATPRRDLTLLVDHVFEVHPDKTFMCRSRDHTRGSGLFKCDCWQKEPNGDLTCTFCGSLREEDLMDILTHYADGEPGYHFSRTHKSYKVYANRPGVQNAALGGIKFYGWHKGADSAENNAVFDRAMVRYRAELEKLGYRETALP